MSEHLLYVHVFTPCVHVQLGQFVCLSVWSLLACSKCFRALQVSFSAIKMALVNKVAYHYMVLESDHPKAQEKFSSHLDAD